MYAELYGRQYFDTLNQKWQPVIKGEFPPLPEEEELDERWEKLKLSLFNKCTSIISCKEVDLETNSTGYKEPALRASDLETIKKVIADKQTPWDLVELSKTERWLRVDGTEGSLLKTFPKGTLRNMLENLKTVREGVHRGEEKALKSKYLPNISRRIAVIEYILGV